MEDYKGTEIFEHRRLYIYIFFFSPLLIVSAHTTIPELIQDRVDHSMN